MKNFSAFPIMDGVKTELSSNDLQYDIKDTTDVFESGRTFANANGGEYGSYGEEPSSGGGGRSFGDWAYALLGLGGQYLQYQNTQNMTQQQYQAYLQQLSQQQAELQKKKQTIKIVAISGSLVILGVASFYLFRSKK